ncbi:hypothetical protein GCM10022254_16400 [Actinomadura meridiana]|uniref:Deoxyribonuclease NucA/NucB domain-containing protein n=2 Tax=Actinomadura meridiana TaxID=559626 RepID=A0ABP8BVQ9_9ACTN
MPNAPNCSTGRDKDGVAVQLCLEPVNPADAPAPPPLDPEATADPVPPPICYTKPGEVNYDRFHACQQSTIRVKLTKQGLPAPIISWIWWATWETLNRGNRSWKMQVGLRPYDMPGDLVRAKPEIALRALCTQHCDLPDAEEKSVSTNNKYVYFDGQDILSSGNRISYSSPWIRIVYTLHDVTMNPPKQTLDLSTPFNIRCDSEAYIGSRGGCVHYMGHDAIPIYYLDYQGRYPDIAKNALYGMTDGDPVKHYGNIQYGNPLTREDPHLIDTHRNSICTSRIRAKASALGLSCDEYPYAASEQGGSGNERFSCAFADEDQNEGQGRDMDGRFFVPNRVLPARNEVGTPYIPGDAFWVWVTNAPDDPPAVKQCSTY